MEIVYLLAGIAIGGGVGWLLARNRFLADQRGVSSLLIVEQEKARTLLQRMEELTATLERERQRVLELTNSVAASEANNRNLEEKISEKKLDLLDMQEKFSVQFKNLANDIFEEKSKRFTEQNKSNIFDLLQPLGAKITEFEKRVQDTHKDTVSGNAALRQQLETLQQLNLQMTQEAENLTRALKGDSKAQGAWGEFILESILEKSGLERGREYTVQESFDTEEGRRRPDVIIRLPENKHVVIDSKVSLTAYNNFINATNEEEKAIALKAHMLSIRQHMKGLGDKKYQNLTPNSLDFTIMFIPIEPAYILALQTEKNLYEEALERRIVFVSPTLLIPSLQLIKNVWKQENQTRNVIDIAEKAGALYDKFVGFSDDLINLGRSLDNTVKIYGESMNKITSGSGNLVKRVEDLKKLGAKASKTIDPKLLRRSEDQQGLIE